MCPWFLSEHPLFQFFLFIIPLSYGCFVSCCDHYSGEKNDKFPILHLYVVILISKSYILVVALSVENV